MQISWVGQSTTHTHETIHALYHHYIFYPHTFRKDRVKAHVNFIFFKPSNNLTAWGQSWITRMSRFLCYVTLPLKRRCCKHHYGCKHPLSMGWEWIDSKSEDIETSAINAMCAPIFFATSALLTISTEPIRKVIRWMQTRNNNFNKAILLKILSSKYC